MLSMLKSITRIPILKLDRIEEFCPPSLCHGIYFFVNDVMVSLTSTVIEKANILHKGIAAYRKGKWCTMLVCSTLGMCKDTIESNKPTACFQEDNEFFLSCVSWSLPYLNQSSRISKCKMVGAESVMYVQRRCHYLY